MLADMSDYHDTYIKYFGANNKLRLTGLNETSSYNRFSYGLDNRACSVRIPTKPVKSGNIDIRHIQGYLEDRRPGANSDPYVVCSLIA
jgi:glutamine synthetase